MSSRASKPFSEGPIFNREPHCDYNRGLGVPSMFYSMTSLSTIRNIGATGILSFKLCWRIVQYAIHIDITCHLTVELITLVALRQ